ncbi:Uncharacterised protein [[Eubacterium] contortum]|uniref:Uncharacterized protein n=1 Tax=Faecalicatena contorta TaxID=39482 RepID=A0A174B3X2_9FIRM|nr:Uncharacterised protein [[Eubacterium] contortum] [Faecalicatena contorta]
MFFGFYEFSYNPESESSGHMDDAGDDFFGALVGLDLGYELAVQFYLAEYSFLQVEDGVVAHAEIVQTELDSVVLENFYILAECFGYAHRRTFSYLEYQVDSF